MRCAKPRRFSDEVPAGKEKERRKVSTVIPVKSVLTVKRVCVANFLRQVYCITYWGMLSGWFICFILVPIPLLSGGHLSKELTRMLSQHGEAHGVGCHAIHYLLFFFPLRKSEHRELEAVRVGVGWRGDF